MQSDNSQSQSQEQNDKPKADNFDKEKNIADKKEPDLSNKSADEDAALKKQKDSD